MKLAWMFGNSMAAHHLLYVYVSVWLIQGGYCAWIAWKWMRSTKDFQRKLLPPSNSREQI